MADFADDYEWGICWDFQRESQWTPEGTLVFPPGPAGGSSWKKNTNGSGKPWSKKWSAPGMDYGGAPVFPWTTPEDPAFAMGDPSMMGGDMAPWAAWDGGIPPGMPAPFPPGADMGPYFGDAFGGPPPPPPPPSSWGGSGGKGGRGGKGGNSWSSWNNSSSSRSKRGGWSGDGDDGGNNWSAWGQDKHSSAGYGDDEEWWLKDSNPWDSEEETGGRSYNRPSESSKAKGRGRDTYSGDRYSGDRYSGDRYSGDRYSGDRYSGDRYSGERERGRWQGYRDGEREVAAQHGHIEVRLDASGRPLQPSKEAGALSNAIDALIAQVSPVLEKADFDHRVRRALSGIRANGGSSKVTEALAMLKTSLLQKRRDSIQNMPAYLLTLLKKFEAGPPPSEVPPARPMRAEDAPPGLPRTAPPAAPARTRPDPAVSSTSWANVDQEERGTAARSFATGFANVSAVAAEALDAQEDEVDDWPVRKALRQNKLPEALDLVGKLPQISTRVASRVLSALGKSQALTEDVMEKLMDLAGKFEADAFESAANEAMERKDASACAQLYQVAGLMSITKTPQALEDLLRCQAASGDDAIVQQAKAVVEEFVSEDASDESSPKLTQGLAEALAAVAAAAKDTELSASVKKKAGAAGLKL
eukprot:TRINITY_DN9398_c0_g1_i1.p1 TRINITY_DN9398_c0_g1~~TRINITY_DN9398_c0_g1_i1.p1  ORF type:complete len:642 (-),score=150.62 TRINITY_DN9398_c0_g1_i1:373-2298(-)